MVDASLTESDFFVRTDPLALFDEWLADAGRSEINDPNAVALATVDVDGLPDARMVLLKGRDDHGFVFFTNLESAKGRELLAHPLAAMCFHWKSLRRQVRIEGAVAPVSDSEADTYFASRSRDSQLGARASDQSRPLDRRETFEARFEAEKAAFEGRAVERPAHWSGFRVAPDSIEFWSDRAFRLHERRLFTRGEKSWSEGLLYP